MILSRWMPFDVPRPIDASPSTRTPSHPTRRAAAEWCGPAAKCFHPRTAAADSRLDASNMLQSMEDMQSALKLGGHDAEEEAAAAAAAGVGADRTWASEWNEVESALDRRKWIRANAARILQCHMMMDETVMPSASNQMPRHQQIVEIVVSSAAAGVQLTR